jgi:hypothetical protein
VGKDATSFTHQAFATGQWVPSLTEEQMQQESENSLWERIRKALNVNDLPRLFRDTGFWAGIIIRMVTLIGFLMFLNIAGDITDMNELVFEGMANLLQGINPYGQNYLLNTFAGPFTQDYFNYPPFAILCHLPSLLWPGPPSIGTMDFMPGFFILHWFFDFVTYYRLWQNEHTIISKIIWLTPFFVFVDVITFMSLPLMLLTLCLLNLERPMRNGVYATLLAATYQMGAIFLPFLLIFHWRRDQLRLNLLGMLPVLVVVFAFFFWNPLPFVQDLLIHQIGRPPVNWQDFDNLSPYYNRYYPLTFLFMGSIPSWAFNLGILLGVPPPIAPQIAPMMMSFVIVLGLIGLWQFIKTPRKALAILLPGLLLALFIASTAEGLAHYWVLCLTLPFIFWGNVDTLNPSTQKGTKSSRTTEIHSKTEATP